MSSKVCVKGQSIVEMLIFMLFSCWLMLGNSLFLDLCFVRKVNFLVGVLFFKVCS